jgi:exodeoxyribonuclease III
MESTGSSLSLKRKVKEAASVDAPVQIEKKVKRAKKAPLAAIAATEEIAEHDESGEAPVKQIEKKTKKKAAKKVPAAVTATEEIADTIATDAAAVEEPAAKMVKKPRAPPAPPSIHAGPSDFSTGVHLKAPSLDEFIASIPAKTPGCSKIACYNVNGLRSILDKPEKLEAFKQWIEAEEIDVLAIQEHKCQDPSNSKKTADVIEKANEFFRSLGLSHSSWAFSQVTLGYSGVAVFSRAPFLSTSIGISDPEGDAEGRTITVETKDFYLVNLYMPNSGVGDLKRLDYRTTVFEPKLRAHLKSLSAKPVVLCGDLNVAFHDMDVHDPKGNRNKQAGFCDAERDGFAALLSECALEDVYRVRNPVQQQFTYFSSRFDCRTKGKGWRLDYFLVSPALAKKVKTIDVRATWSAGADHLPIVAEIS